MIRTTTRVIQGGAEVLRQQGGQTGQGAGAGQGAGGGQAAGAGQAARQGPVQAAEEGAVQGAANQQGPRVTRSRG